MHAQEDRRDCVHSTAFDQQGETTESSVVPCVDAQEQRRTDGHCLCTGPVCVGDPNLLGRGV